MSARPVRRAAGCALGIALLALWPPAISAHEVRPAYLELRQTGPDRYDIFWKVPALGDGRRLAIHVGLPDGCAADGPIRRRSAAGAFTEHWSAVCPGGLIGRAVQIAGLNTTTTDVLVRLDRLDGTSEVTRLTPTSPSFVVAASPTRMAVVGTYLPLGVTHILAGVDHLLFVLGLLLLVKGTGRLVATITAFTVAHSVTLSLAALGVVRVPPPPVEATIALSILFVACEIRKAAAGTPSFAQRNPWVVAFSFGLLHGLGFAGGLSEAGLPAAHIPLALLIFSIGVEAGHMAFIAAVLAVGAVIRRVPVAPPRWMEAIPAYGIGGIAAFWVIQRLAAY